MVLVEAIPANRPRINPTGIYINTLTPCFQFKNKKGRVVMPIKRCILQ